MFQKAVMFRKALDRKYFHFFFFYKEAVGVRVNGGTRKYTVTECGVSVFNVAVHTATNRQALKG